MVLTSEMEFSINQLERVERGTNLNRSQIVLPAAKLLEFGIMINS